MRLRDRCGESVKPFTRVTLKERCRCRFCEAKANDAVYRIQEKQGLDFDPREKHETGINPWMKKGDEAVRLVTTCGPAGTAYVCIPCAESLLENLQRELEK